MTSTLTRSKTPPSGDGRAGRVGIDPGRSRRRSLPLAAVAVACMAVSIVAFVGLQLAGSDRASVLVVARPVSAGATIGLDDLTVAQVAPDPALRPIGATERESVVGRTAAIDLTPGSLLVEDALGPARALAVDEAIVGVAVAAASAPTTALAVGDRVQLVETQSAPTTSSVGTPTQSVLAEGRVTDVTDSSSTSGNGAVQLAVAVPGVAAPSIAAASADGRIAVVVIP